MRRDFPLENGIYCKGLINDFKLYYNAIELTPNCNNMAYIPNTLIAVKSSTTIYVYEPKTIDIGGFPLLRKIANFESKSPNAFLMVNVSDKAYIINYKLQVCRCNSIKSY